MATSSAYRILLVEPDSTFSNEISHEFQNRKFEVVAINDGFRASRMCEEEKFSAYIIASKLSGMSGLQVAATLRSVQPQLKNPIFLITETLDKETSKRAVALGIAQVLPKPVVVKEMADKIEEALKALRPASTAAYDVRIMNAFIEAMKETLVFYLDNKLVLGKPTLKGDENAIGYLSALISFAGESAKGSMAMSFQKAFLGRLAAKIFPDNKGPVGDDMLADMAGEMCNQVCGAVKTKFAGLGLKVMIGLPKVVVGEKHRLIHIVKNPVIAVPVSYESDRCSIEFCMDKSTEPLEEAKEKETKDESSAKGGDVLLF